MSGGLSVGDYCTCMGVLHVIVIGMDMDFDTQQCFYFLARVREAFEFATI